MTRPDAVLESVRIRCARAGVVDVGPDDLRFSGDSEECELCGSHGSVEMTVSCPCGTWHDIIVHTW